MGSSTDLHPTQPGFLSPTSFQPPACRPTTLLTRTSRCTGLPPAASTKSSLRVKVASALVASHQDVHVEEPHAEPFRVLEVLLQRVPHRLGQRDVQSLDALQVLRLQREPVLLEESHDVVLVLAAADASTTAKCWRHAPGRRECGSLSRETGPTPPPMLSVSSL